MNAIFELWSGIQPERAIACSFNLEYLLVGGRDARTDDRPFFMWYDWMAGGWGGRSTKDGSTATAPVFGVGLAVHAAIAVIALAQAAAIAACDFAELAAHVIAVDGLAAVKVGTTHQAAFADKQFI